MVVDLYACINVHGGTEEVRTLCCNIGTGRSSSDYGCNNDVSKRT